MAANPYGVNGPRMGQSHGRLRNSMLNQLSKMAGGRSYPTTLVSRPGGLPQSPTAPGPAAQAPGATPFQVSIPQRSPMSLEQPTVPLVSATPVLDLSGGTEALNQAAQNLAVLAQLAGTRGQGSGTPGPGAGGDNGGNNGGGGGNAGGGSRPPIPTALNNVAANMRLARWMAANRGWNAEQWKYLRYIVEGHGGIPGESNWRGGADNPNSSAVGIGQRLVSAHPWTSEAEKQHYLHNVQYQLAWMFNYIQSRYGTPKAAWAFKSTNHNGYWY